MTSESSKDEGLGKVVRRMVLAAEQAKLGAVNVEEIQSGGPRCDGRRSIVGRQQCGNGAVVVVLDEPERFRL